ncbi:MAG: hypothetical protein KBD21_01710 [Candidatus Pacebacteria bacterium]|nr:hypothetical protein [Candidatus Paceibacterota bacterium]
MSMMKTPPTSFSANAPFYLCAVAVLVWLTHTALSTKALRFLDGVNLVFHEAGHWLFFWAPEYVMVLGGTIGQLSIPIVCAFAFWRERKNISAMLMVWWFGQNLVGVSVYMSDAREQALPLLGGENSGHDWSYMLGELDVLSYDQVFGSLTFAIAAIIMIVAVLMISVRLLQAVNMRV